MDDREEGRSGAERAFEDLRSEVTVLRRAVEALPEAWKSNRPADTTETLGKIVERLNIVGSHLGAIEKHPALELTPKQHQNAIIVAGGAVMHSAVNEFGEATTEARRRQSELAALIGSMRGKRQQLERILWTGVAAVLLGLVMSPVLARWLPFGWDGQVAAFILHADRWQAGMALMQVDDPKAWAEVGAAIDAWKSYKAPLESCREAAAKTKKEQRCTLTVLSP